ncbi:MAG: competence/damage-inducible protein A [Actinomycetota bacterium]
MRAEIVGVGTELLLGQIANTNAQKISSDLAAIGVDVLWHSVVGDNLERIVSVLELARERADVLVLTGGLGPTPDDITSEAVSRLLGRPLRRDERLAQVIRGKFAAMKRAMPEANLKQADLPEGAVPIEAEGTAPGYYLDDGSALIFVLPGVPWEMEAMLEKTVVPLLALRSGAATTVSREVVIIGLGESSIHEAIKDLVEAQTNPTIAYRAEAGRVRVRVTAKAQNGAAAEALITPLETEIRARLGDVALGPEATSLPEALSVTLRHRGETVAVAESLTGGRIAAELSDQPGSSDFFVGSLVCYTTASKAAVALVPDELLERRGPVSEEVAGALAVGAAARFDAALGLGATGVAGPGAHDGEPAGTICVGAAYRSTVITRRLRGYGSRANVMAMAVTAALDLGRRALSHEA